MNTIKVDYQKRHAVVYLDNGKVNAINTALAQEIKEIFLELDKNDKVEGVILAGRPHGFSAGLDVAHLAVINQEEGKEFWEQYLGMLQALVRFRKPFVCAITGYAPAGATIITLCADYRVMGKGKKHVVGMHEFRMSMQIPEMMCDVYTYYLGEKVAWEAVQQCKLYNSDQALAAGLVNESVEVEEVMERAEKQLKFLMNLHPPVFQKSKRYFRKGLLALVDKNIDAMTTEISNDWQDPFVQANTKAFLASLQRKKK
ncbi:MAG: enoyl-CoA hydratase/isomerase family protein [Chitinophagales bacterium]